MSSIGEKSETEELRELVRKELKRWPALTLAAEHGMGGPPTHCSALVYELTVQVTSTLTAEHSEWGPLADLLDDFMDLRFDTWLQDNSHYEVAQKLWELYRLFKGGQIKDCNQTHC